MNRFHRLRANDVIERGLIDVRELKKKVLRDRGKIKCRSHNIVVTAKRESQYCINSKIESCRPESVHINANANVYINVIINDNCSGIGIGKANMNNSINGNGSVNGNINGDANYDVDDKFSMMPVIMWELPLPLLSVFRVTAAATATRQMLLYWYCGRS